MLKAAAKREGTAHMTTYARPESLAETAWLAERIGDPGLRVIEVDEDTTAYHNGHIPGAIGWNWPADLHTTVGRDYLDQATLSKLLAAAGVGQDTTVILYGGNSNWFAAYAYWIVKLRGFDAVRLLNGGRKKWELESRELVTDVPQYPHTSYQIRARERPEFRAHCDEVLAAAGTRTGLVDVRSPEEYRGKELGPDHLPGEQAQVPGHIPGAVNVPWARAANDDGTFKPADELLTVYSRLGITSDQSVITYCRTGERSCHTWFALTELLGYPDAKNYDGSWTEYGSLIGVPVEIG